MRFEILDGLELVEDWEMNSRLTETMIFLQQ